MSSTNGLKLIIFMLVSAVLLAMAIPAALAEEKTANAGPDIQVIVGSTGGSVGSASIEVDGAPVGKTDSKGNFTFKEAPAAGDHTILVSAKGINNTTVSTTFAEKPVVVKVEPAKGYSMTVHVTDKAKQGIAGVSILNGKYLMGMTNEKGDVAINNCPMGLYLIKLQKEGYKNSTSLLIVYANDKTQNYVLTY